MVSGSIAAAIDSKVPSGPNPSTSSDMAWLLGAVATITLAPPILVSSSAAFTVSLSR